MMDTIGMRGPSNHGTRVANNFSLSGIRQNSPDQLQKQNHSTMVKRGGSSVSGSQSKSVATGAGDTKFGDTQVDRSLLCIPELTWNEQGLFVFMVMEDELVVQSRPTLLGAGNDRFTSASSSGVVKANELVAVDLIQHMSFSTLTKNHQTLGKTASNESDNAYNKTPLRNNRRYTAGRTGESEDNSPSCGASLSSRSNHPSRQAPISHEELIAVEFVRLADRSGWLPVQQFFISSGTVVAVDRMRQVPLERGLWTLHVDNVPHGQVLKRHPMMQQQQQSSRSTKPGLQLAVELERPRDASVSGSLEVVYQPMQKVFCDACVIHPISQVKFYRVQSTISGWLVDKQMPTLNDPVPRSMLLTTECVQTGCFCFRALYDLTVQPCATTEPPTSSDSTGSSVVKAKIQQGQVVSVDVIRSSPEYDAAGDGPFLRLSDGSGWLFVHKQKRRVMSQVQVQKGLWQVRVTNANDGAGMELRRHPCRRLIEEDDTGPDELDALLDHSPSENATGSTVFPPNTILQCDYQIMDVGSTVYSREGKQKPITFYRVCNTSGWIFDRRPDGTESLSNSELLQLLSESNASPDASVQGDAAADTPWTVDFLRGVTACHGLVEESFQEDPQQVLILSASDTTSTGENLTVTFHVFARTCSVSYMVHPTKKKRNPPLERRGLKKGTYRCNGMKLEKEDEGKIEILSQREYFHCSANKLIEAFKDGVAALASPCTETNKMNRKDPSDPVHDAFEQSNKKLGRTENESPEKTHDSDGQQDDDDDDNTLVYVDKNDVHLVVPVSTENDASNDENIESVWKPQALIQEENEKSQVRSHSRNQNEIYGGPIPHLQQETIPTAASTSSEDSLAKECEDKELNLRLQLREFETEMEEMFEQHRVLLMAVHEYDVRRFREASQYMAQVRERKEEKFVQQAVENISVSVKAAMTTPTRPRRRYSESVSQSSDGHSRSTSYYGVRGTPSDRISRSVSKISNMETPPHGPSMLRSSSRSCKSEGRRSTKEVVARVLSSLDDDYHSDDDRHSQRSSRRSDHQRYSSSPVTPDRRSYHEVPTHALYRCDECNQEFYEPIRSEEDENNPFICRACLEVVLNSSGSMDALEQRRAEHQDD